MILKDSQIAEQPHRTEAHAFIVRIWRQEVGGTEDSCVWRGSIDHVGSSERLYFSDLSAIGRFIQEQAEIGLHGQASRWKSVRCWLASWLKG